MSLRNRKATLPAPDSATGSSGTTVVSRPAYSLATPEVVLIMIATETIAEFARVFAIVPIVIGCEALGSVAPISELPIFILGEAVALEPSLSVCVV